MSGFARRHRAAMRAQMMAPQSTTTTPVIPQSGSRNTAPAPVEAPNTGTATPTPTLDRVAAPSKPADLRTDLGANRPDAAGKLQSVYDANETRIDAAKDKPSASHVAEREAFMSNWAENQERYEAVAKDAGIPAELVAALHWRESSGDFDTYMHQGDPLGKPPVHWPTNIPTFNEWEPSAADALGRFKGVQEDLDITADTKDMAALATFAEYYNGLGYHNKGKPSPYVFAGTDQYTSGKYVADGVYSSSTVDRQAGVVYLMEGIREAQAKQAAENGGTP